MLKLGHCEDTSLLLCQQLKIKKYTITNPLVSWNTCGKNFFKGLNGHKKLLLLSRNVCLFNYLPLHFTLWFKCDELFSSHWFSRSFLEGIFDLRKFPHILTAFYHIPYFRMQFFLCSGISYLVLRYISVYVCIVMF